MSTRVAALKNVRSQLDYLVQAEALGDVSWPHMVAAAARNRDRHIDPKVEFRSPLLEGSTSGELLAAGQPVLDSPFRRRVFLRNVTQVLPVSTWSTPMVRETNPQSGEAAVSGVAEGGLKPDIGATVDFTVEVIEPGVLAVNATCSDQLLADSPAFALWLQGRMGYLVSVAEERAALFGTGTVADGGITGVVHTTGVQTVPAGAVALHTALMAGAAQVAAGGAMPSAAFVNAQDFLNDFAVLPTFYGPALPLQVLPTTTVPAGQAVVGDFARGATLLDREQSNVQIYSQHLDYRTQGLALIQGEERVGWHVSRPWSFANVTYGS